MPPPAPADPADAGRPWASLPEDLIRLVASRLLAGDLLDYVRFRAVCTSWLSATASPRGRGVADPHFHPRRWMMFPEGHGLYPGHPDLRGYIRFVNLDTGTLVRAHLPLFADHVAMDSVDGLLVLFREHDTAVRLLHPFTGDIVEFPPLATLVPQIAARRNGEPAPSAERLTRIVCASVYCSAGAVTVMLALHFQVRRVAFASTLDQQQQWNLSSWMYEYQNPPLSFRGKLYVAHTVLFSNDVQIHQIDPPVKDGVHSVCEPQPPKLIATLPDLVNHARMVECDSEILVLGHKDYWPSSPIVVFKLADLVRQRYIQITSIGGNTLFMSERSLSVSSRALRTAMGDSVVLTGSSQSHLMQYHLISSTWSPAADACSVYGPAPGPCTLMHHILSCCVRSRWNTGRIFGRNPKGWYGGR